MWRLDGRVVLEVVFISGICCPTFGTTYETVMFRRIPRICIGGGVSHLRCPTSKEVGHPEWERRSFEAAVVPAWASLMASQQGTPKGDTQKYLRKRHLLPGATSARQLWPGA